MSATELNRIGIVLTFVAGFLLAPQLIGLGRIGRAQQRIEKRLDLLRSSAGRHMTAQQVAVGERDSDRLSASILGWGADDAVGVYTFSLYVYALGFVAAASYFGWTLTSSLVPGWLAVLLALFLASAAALMWSAVMIFIVPRERAVTFFMMRASIAAAVWPIAVIAFGWQSFLRIRYVVAIVMGPASVAILRRLERDRLIGWMTIFGIAAFVAGSALQFVATFQ